MKKKIALVITGLTIGGAEKVVVDLAIQFQNCQKCEVLVIIIGEELENQLSHALNTNGIKYVFLERDKYSFFSTFFHFNSIMDNFKAEAVYVHLDMRFSWLWSLINHKKIIFTIHSQPSRIFDKKSIILYKLLRKLNLITLISVSSIIEQETIELLRITKNKDIKTIHNPVTIPDTIPLCKEHDRVVFVNVARLIELKNHILLLKAFKNVVKLNNNVVLYIAGEGNQKEHLRKFIEENNLLDRIFLLGNVENIPELLNNSDVFVLSSRTEALPISIIEAMAYGLPIISTNVGGVSELVTNNGILVNSEDVLALTNAMIEVANNESIRRRMAFNSYKNIKPFSCEVIAKEYLKIYENSSKC